MHTQFREDVALQKYKENNENIRNAVTVGHGSKNLFYNQTSKGLSQDNVVKKIDNITLCAFFICIVTSLIVKYNLNIIFLCLSLFYHKLNLN